METRNYEEQEGLVQNGPQLNAAEAENERIVFEDDQQQHSLYAAEGDDDDDDDIDDDIDNDDNADDDDEESGDWGDVDPQGNDGLGSGNEPSAPGSAV